MAKLFWRHLFPTPFSFTVLHSRGWRSYHFCQPALWGRVVMWSLWPRDESLLEASESASAFLTLPPFNPQLSVLFKIIIYLLHQVLVVAHRIFRCILWDLVPRLGIQLGPLALEAWSFSRWTTREVPYFLSWIQIWCFVLDSLFVNVRDRWRETSVLTLEPQSNLQTSYVRKKNWLLLKARLDFLLLATKYVPNWLKF